MTDNNSGDAAETQQPPEIPDIPAPTGKRMRQQLAAEQSELTGIDLLRQRRDELLATGAAATMRAEADEPDTALGGPIPATQLAEASDPATVIVEPIDYPSAALAWSEATDTATALASPAAGNDEDAATHEAPPRDGRQPLPRTLIALLIAVAVSGAALVAFVIGGHEAATAPRPELDAPAIAAQRAPDATDPHPAAQPPLLDGLYQITTYPARATFHVKKMVGAVDNTPFTTWNAFRAVCLPDGCVSMETAMSDDDHQTPKPNQVPTPWTFRGGAWQPAQPQIGDMPNGNDGCDEKLAMTMTLAASPDGAFDGMATTVVADDGCGFIGNRVDTPAHAVRIGDAPPAAAMPPATMPPVESMPDLPQWPEATLSASDEQLLADLADRGVPLSKFKSGARGAVAAAHGTCESLASGISADNQAAVLSSSSDDIMQQLSPQQAQAFVSLSIAAYCPS